MNLEAMTKIGLENGRDNSELITIKPIDGGSINEAFYVKTREGEYFMKHHANSQKDFFKSEAIGLRIIKETETISVPNYLSYSDKHGEAFLLMEWIEGKKSAETESILGRNLAQLHRTFGTMHGFKNDTYIGILDQPNTLEPNWLAYFRENRLNYHVKNAIDKGLLVGSRKDKFLRLLDNLDKWIPTFVEPSYLHGDLYSGNWLVGPSGEPYLVDPSFFYGDRHLEIAFTEVFGGFSKEFYDSYNENFPLHENYEEIKQIYQLYYILVHFIMFGESYGKQIDEILNYYVS